MCRNPFPRQTSQLPVFLGVVCLRDRRNPFTSQSCSYQYRDLTNMVNSVTPDRAKGPDRIESFGFDLLYAMSNPCQ